MGFLGVCHMNATTTPGSGRYSPQFTDEKTEAGGGLPARGDRVTARARLGLFPKLLPLSTPKLPSQTPQQTQE